MCWRLREVSCAIWVSGKYAQQRELTTLFCVRNSLQFRSPSSSSMFVVASHAIEWFPLDLLQVVNSAYSECDYDSFSSLCLSSTLGDWFWGNDDATLETVTYALDKRKLWKTIIDIDGFKFFAFLTFPKILPHLPSNTWAQAMLQQHFTADVPTTLLRSGLKISLSL